MGVATIYNKKQSDLLLSKIGKLCFLSAIVGSHLSTMGMVKKACEREKRAKSKNIVPLWKD